MEALESRLLLCAGPHIPIEPGDSAFAAFSQDLAHPMAGDAAGPAVLDLLVLYTPASKNSAGGKSKIEERIGYRILGFFENGFRQVSNRLRPVHEPADLAGMRIRVLPSKIQARTFELLGAVPLMWDLTEALAAIKAGEIDAQENPLANTVTYGAHKFHRFHTLTNHFYISRPIFVHRPTFDGYPKDLQEAFRKFAKEAIAFQRGLAIEEDVQARSAIKEAGCEVIALNQKEHESFVAVVKPIYGEARKQYDRNAMALVGAG